MDICMKKYPILLLAFLCLACTCDIGLAQEAPQIPAPGKVSLVDLGSDCIPCDLQDRIVRRVTKDFPDSVAVFYLDVEKEPRYKKEYRIEIIPTLIFYDKKGKEVERRSGYMKEGAMRKLLTKLTAE
jgi:thiol-disulfide isomerase/thioredoxin